MILGTRESVLRKDWDQKMSPITTGSSPFLDTISVRLTSLLLLFYTDYQCCFSVCTSQERRVGDAPASILDDSTNDSKPRTSQEGVC